ncbi:small VCP/p97-interacting protein [Cimex lectularius]|uniref:Small VCP/p97-interacting protein n=1 Tax=Cimex lectularius TaxID=79782 RepID=A0A8I6RJ07_CIMLE|nr:small VCP/p97-interacting protein [Cimex lectularius]
MGVFLSCCKGGGEDLLTPDAETKRKRMAEAAERRLKENESRGVKNLESVKRMQEKDRERERLEKLQQVRGDNGPALKWTVS